MLSFRTLGVYGYLFILAISLVGCQQNLVSQPPEPLPATTTPAETPSPQPTVAPRQDDAQLYQQAVSKAEAANAIRQSAISKDDWLLIADNMQSSIDLLKSIAPDSNERKLADKLLPEYQQKLATARSKAVNFVPPQPASVPVVAAERVNMDRSIANSSNSFSIPIVEKLGGIPVVEVKFNSNVTARMLLDTGASRTLIDNALAEQLQLKILGKSQAHTANGVGEFGVASLDSIKFGNGETRNVMVAVGKNSLQYGLLGHDVYDGYDITIKENSIEFKQRS
jgi:hypothetical protein